MHKRQFLTAAAALAAAPAFGQAQMKKPGTDDLGRTLSSMKAKPIPRRKAKTTKNAADRRRAGLQRHHRRSEWCGLLGAAATS